MNIHDIMQRVVDSQGSDIHLITGIKPYLRIDGQLVTIEDAPVLQASHMESLVFPLLTREQREKLMINKEIDLGYQYGDRGRFRVNVYYQRGELAAALRLIPSKIKTLEDLGLPATFHQFTKYKQGLVLVTGPTGEGKSTTLAAMIEEINITRSEHVLTIEDPIEFVYTPKQSIISQREVNQDTHGWEIALRSALREDPDVVLVGELRDYETIAAALTVAETGHLVFGTLHTYSAAQTIDRIIDVFPAGQQNQVRQQLSATLKAVISQRLIPQVNGGRIAAVEVMLANSAVQNLIREQKVFQIDSVIQTATESGMNLMEMYLAQLVQRGAITVDKAREYAIRPQELDRLISG